MRIVKKIPKKPHGRAEEKKLYTRDAIREAYTKGSSKEVKIIPAKKDVSCGERDKKLRVCAYCRVSTDEDSQAGSYELQVQNYKQYIQQNPDWEFVGIYADEGISGTSVLHRENFLRMIRDCEAGKIDLIITKQVNRFARNVLDSLHYIRMLKTLDNPVGVFFESEGLNTLGSSSEMIITVLSLVAQEESEQKSKSIKWAYKRRWQKNIGIRPNWALLGYSYDETTQEWFINEDEAELVRAIYDLYIEGNSSTQIAEILTQNKIPTVRGLSKWSSGTIIGILKNEKYCGDALCQKTVTTDLFTHKVVKNDGIEPQYYIEGHHEPIIDRDTWNKAQQIRVERRNMRKRKCKKPKHIVKGQLSGFILVDRNWDTEFVDAYLKQVIYDKEIAPNKE